MSDYELSIATGRTGQTIFARLINGITQEGSDVPMSPLSGLGTVYYGSVPNDTPAGHYDILFLSAGSLIGNGELDWDGSNEITRYSIQTAIAQLMGLGTGPNPISITVTDTDSNPIQSALVSLWLNGQVKATCITDVNGVASTSAPSDTYTLTIYASGFNPLNQELVVAAAVTTDKTLAALTTPTNSADGVTASAYTYKPDGTTIEPNIRVEYQMCSLGDGDTGLINPDSDYATSDSQGLVEFTLRPLAKYRFRTARSKQWQTITAKTTNFSFGIVG